MNRLLEINDLSVTFSMEQAEIQAVKDVSLTIEVGETVAIVGESGAGKSQLFHAVLGLQAKNANLTGSARFQGRELLNVSNKVLNTVRGTAINIIFQDPMTALNPYLKIGKQLSEVLQVHERLNQQEARKRSINALAEVKIPKPEKCYNQYPHELSGGMRQRVMIAMALLTNPKLIIADEPTTALDVGVQTEIITLLKKAHNQNNTSIVLITHDVPLVAGLCDRLVVMYAGKIVETGKLDEIHNHALHPYTRALINATPNYSLQINSTGKLDTIAGNPPSPNEVIKGCAFAPRCELADKRCENESPELESINKTQSVACFHMSESQ